MAEACVEAGCGDGFLDAASGEQCDDGNEDAFDGCEPDTCAFTCVDSSVCDNENPCDGVESCTDGHFCSSGAAPGAGSPCTLGSGEAGVCRGIECVSPGCGNGAPDAGEECDDGNDTEGDGCDGDCTLSCSIDADCADSDVCNGTETCEVATHACLPGESLVCTDTDDCTADTCDPTAGCQFPLIDADGDGHAPEGLGPCGDDCDEGDAAVFAGAPEVCDGVDNDCNGIDDDGAPTWYVDCDGDGFATDTSGATEPNCMAPSVPPTGCAGGGAWTSRRPTAGSDIDCNDANANVFPGQTAYFTTPISGAPTATRYDYDCSGGHTLEVGCRDVGVSACSTCSTGYLDESASNPNGCAFSCTGVFCLKRPPDCGQTAAYGNCGCVFGVLPYDRRQGCR